MGLFLNAVARLHLVSVAVKAVGRVVKMVAHSNFGLIGLDRVMSWLGLG